MMYAMYKSRGNALFDTGYEMDSRHFGKFGAAVISILVMLSTLALAFDMDMVNALMPPMPEWLEKLGQALPPAIMSVLIVYCLKDAGENWRKIGFPKLLAVFVTAVCYRRTHNTMISIVFGTACYMILLRI